MRWTWSLLVSLFAIASLLQSLAVPCALAKGAPIDSVDIYRARMAVSLGDPKQRSQMLFMLAEGVRTGRIPMATPSQTEKIASFMSNLLDHDPDPVVRGSAARFLAERPHPAAANALLRAATNHAISESHERYLAVDALVALGDRRVTAEIEWNLRDSKRRSARDLRRLVDLGDSAGIELLASFAEDTTHSLGMREEARRSKRDLRLRLEEGLVIDFPLADSTLNALRAHDFAMVPSGKNEMYELYGGPHPFVTSDVIAHTWMILVRASLDELDQLVLRPAITDWVVRLQKGCLRQANSLTDDVRKQGAFRNAAVFEVARTLLTGQVAEPGNLPRTLVDSVGVELRRIREHAGPGRSALYNCSEDFGKYTPRGRYSGRPDLEGYYQAMMYLGRMSFQSVSLEQTRQAILLLDVLDHDGRATRSWKGIDSLLTLVYGEHDDPTFEDYSRIASSLKRPQRMGRPTYLRMAADSTLLREFGYAVMRERAPLIYDAMMSGSIAGGVPRVGLRIFGMRYTRPIHVLQETMNQGIWPPSGLDVAAGLLGSGRAREVLAAVRSPLPRAVTTNLVEQARGVAIPPDPKEATTLSEGWIQSSRGLFEPGPNAPSFMSSAAWEEKQINSALGAWAEIQHTTVLYTKDASVTKGAFALVDRFHGYVEPVPTFFLQLKRTVDGFSRAMERCRLFARIEEDRRHALDSLIIPAPDDPGFVQKRMAIAEASVRVERAQLDDLSEMLDLLASMASKELRGEPLSIDDEHFFSDLDRRLMRLSFNRSMNHARVPMSLVVDVATEYQSEQCLEIAIGRPYTIYIAVPERGKKYVCQGAVYSYREFVKPLAMRLTDEEWRPQSVQEAPSPEPAWITSRPGLVVGTTP